MSPGMARRRVNDTSVMPSRIGTKSISLLIMYRVIISPGSLACYGIIILGKLSTIFTFSSNLHSGKFIFHVFSLPRLISVPLSIV